MLWGLEFILVWILGKVGTSINRSTPLWGLSTVILPFLIPQIIHIDSVCLTISLSFKHSHFMGKVFWRFSLDLTDHLVLRQGYLVFLLWFRNGLGHWCIGCQKLLLLRQFLVSPIRDTKPVSFKSTGIPEMICATDSNSWPLGGVSPGDVLVIDSLHFV